MKIEEPAISTAPGQNQVVGTCESRTQPNKVLSGNFRSSKG